MEPRGFFSKRIQKLRDVFNQREQWKNYTNEQNKLISKNVLPFSVLLISLNGDLNVGMSIRNSHLTGASEVIVYGRRKYDKRTTVGAVHYSNVISVHGLDSDLNVDYAKLTIVLLEKNLTPVFIEQHPSRVLLEDVKWNFTNNDKHYCFIFGNESTGIPASFISECLVTFQGSFVIELTQLNIIRSYNVSNAVSIVCYSFMTNYLKQFK
jgi:tRNA G18 (ribose-2'-O)-methylase SpoU